MINTLTPQNPIGMFFQAQGLGGKQYADVLDHVRTANYSTSSVLNNFKLCRDIQDILPNCVVVHRDSNFEPKPGNNKKTIQDHLKTLDQDKRIKIMVNCEAGFDKDRVKMWAEMLPAANDMGWNLVVANTASGSVRSGQLQGDGSHDANEWLTVGAPLLQALAANPGNFLGYHNYTSAFIWLVSNGTYQFQNPSHKPIIDWLLAQWHIGRDLQGIILACQVLGIPVPYQIVTEGLFDQMNDTQNDNPKNGNPYKGIKSNRWRDIISFWATVFPGIEPEIVLASQYQWAWDNILSHTGKVVGVHAFTHLSPALAEGEWKGDDLANAPLYLRAMETWRPSGSITLPTQPPPTIPTTPAMNTARLLAIVAELRDRATEIESIVKGK